MQARYEVHGNRDNNTVSGSKLGNAEFDMSSLFDKDIEAGLDSFENLFCRRCLVFDCKLHGCSQDLIFPAKKHCTLNRMEEEKLPYGPYCYRRVEGNVVTSPNEQKSARSSDGINNNVQASRKKLPKKRLKSSQSETSESETRPVNDGNSKSKLDEKRGIRQINSKRIADHVMVAVNKRQKRLSVTVVSDSESDSHKETEEANSSSSLKVKSKSMSGKRGRRRKDSFVPVVGDTSLQAEVVSDCHPSKEINSDEKWKKEEFVEESISRQESVEFKSWKTIEKSLFGEGLEIFGRNSRLIARNLMNGMKTCT